MKAAQGSHVHGEVVNMSPEHSEPRRELKSNFPPPAPPSPDSDPSPLWNTVQKNLQSVPSSNFEPEPLVLPVRSPNINLNDIYKIKPLSLPKSSCNIATSPTKSRVKPPFITAVSPSKNQVRSQFRSVASPSKISTVDSSVQTSGFFPQPPASVKQVKSAGE